MLSSDNQTPPELIHAFQQLDGAIFLNTNALAARVHDISEFHNCRYISRSTGPTRKTQLFACRYYRSIFMCNACLRISYDPQTKIAKFESCDIQHTHDISGICNTRTRNSLSSTQREKIIAATKQGETAYKIRMQEKLTCSKDVLYGARRETIQKMKAVEMESLVDEMKSWLGWENIINIDDNRRFDRCFLFHKRVMEQNYCNVICIIDDTSCTNYYGLPILMLISEDPNGHSQVLSFSIMPSRVKTVFVEYLSQLKERIGSIRLFISDRNKTQISAIKEVFPDALIIYCSLHISRNIKQKVGREIYHLYKQMRFKQITEDEFLERCQQYIEANQGTKSARFMQSLLAEKEHWLPSITSTYIHCDNITTNRVEGFFGTLKNILEHKTQTLANVIRAIYIRAERLWINSLNEKVLALPSDLIIEEDAAKIGRYASAIILAEYTDLHEKGSLSVPCSPTCCTNHILFNLPCRHLLLERMQHDRLPLLSIDDIPLRWQCSKGHQEQPNSVKMLQRPKNREAGWAYQSCIDKFERYFTVAERYTKIQKILNNALGELESLEHSDAEGQILPPKSLLIPGARHTHPRANVDKASGTPRKKKKYTCSICGSSSHTAPRCPVAISCS